jgi:hypothetical protein
VQFGLDRFVKSRFQSRRECAKQTRKSRDRLASLEARNEVTLESTTEPTLKRHQIFARAGAEHTASIAFDLACPIIEQQQHVPVLFISHR